MTSKRAFDLVVAGTGLAVASPLMALIAIVIRLDSKGPAIFRQERVGLNAAPFHIHKFRSLRVDAEGGLISPVGDPRITRVGTWLRRTKADELPQLFDVLLGHMSLVGPRPEVPHYVALWPRAARDIILSVRPGITDRASIALRDEAEQLSQAADPERHYIEILLPQKVAMYLSYVQSRTFVGDLAIIVDTVRVVLGGVGGTQGRPLRSPQRSRAAAG